MYKSPWHCWTILDLVDFMCNSIPCARGGSCYIYHIFHLTQPQQGHDPSPPSHLWVIAHGQTTAPCLCRELSPPWWEGKCVSLRRQTLCLSNCSTKTQSSSLNLYVFLLCWSPNLLCDGFGEEALGFGCHCGFMSHDRCRSACPLIVSCGAWCHKQWLILSQQGQLKAKVQWSGSMPEETRRFGLAGLCRKRNTMFAQRYKHNEWSPTFFQSGWRAHCCPGSSSIKWCPCYHDGNMVVCMLYGNIWHFCGSASTSSFSVLPRCGNRGHEFGRMDVNYYCWPVRWCILCAGCVWERTEVLAMELASW